MVFGFDICNKRNEYFFVRSRKYLYGGNLSERYLHKILLEMLLKPETQDIC